MLGLEPFPVLRLVLNLTVGLRRAMLDGSAGYSRQNRHLAAGKIRPVGAKLLRGGVL